MTNLTTKEKELFEIEGKAFEKFIKSLSENQQKIFIDFSKSLSQTQKDLFYSAKLAEVNFTELEE